MVEVPSVTSGQMVGRKEDVTTNGYNPSLKKTKGFRGEGLKKRNGTFSK